MVTSGKMCTQLTAVPEAAGDNVIMVAEPIEAMRFSHDEADTNLLLHTYHAASRGHADVIRHSVETDVAVLVVAAAHRISALLFYHTATQQRSWYISINAIAQKVHKSVKHC